MNARAGVYDYMITRQADMVLKVAATAAVDCTQFKTEIFTVDDYTGVLVTSSSFMAHLLELGNCTLGSAGLASCRELVGRAQLKEL